MGLESMARTLIIFGIVLIVLGSVLFLFGKVPWFGRLPGDIIIRKSDMTLYFPVASMLLLSVVLTILFNIIGRR